MFHIKPAKKFKNVHAALEYLEALISELPKTKLCIGLQTGDVYNKWFNYLIDKKQISPSICVAPSLELSSKVMTETKTYSIDLDINKNYEVIIEEIIQKVKDCINTSIILPLNIYYKENDNFTDAHENIVLINTKNKTYEWFEPHGFITDEKRKEHQIYEMEHNRFNAMSAFFEKDFPRIFKLSEEYKFLSAYGIECPTILGPQHPDFEMGSYLNDCDDIEGYCVTYSTIYAHLRCLMPEANVNQTVRALYDLGPFRMMPFVLRYISWQLVIFGEEYTLKELEKNRISRQERNQQYKQQ